MSLEVPQINSCHSIEVTAILNREEGTNPFLGKFFQFAAF
jgi:hypothetical protein